jgi:hypothetical protein
MKKYSGWNGTDKEIIYILREYTRGIMEEYSDLTERESKSLLCAALASNMVQCEIAGQAEFQYENGYDGSDERNKLNTLVGRYKRAE